MDLFENIKFTIELIANDTIELIEDVQELAAETKNEIISDWKEEVPFIGNTMERTEKFFTLINVAEHLPDIRYKPYEPNIKEVQDRLGHSDVKTTLHLYTRYKKGERRRYTEVRGLFRRLSH